MLCGVRRLQRMSIVDVGGTMRWCCACVVALFVFELCPVPRFLPVYLCHLSPTNVRVDQACEM
jgi:hypothetical protein